MIRTPDPRWEVAESVEVFGAAPHTVTALARDITGDADDRVVDGVLVARPHPTGWFVHAVRRDDLGDDDQEFFREVVTVRTYLLLRQGPGSHAWRPVPQRGEWRSSVASLDAEVAEVMDTVGGLGA